MCRWCGPALPSRWSRPVPRRRCPRCRLLPGRPSQADDFTTNRCAAPAARHTKSELRKETSMNRTDLTEKILDIKREKGWKWKTICDKVGGFSDTLIVGALLGQM